MHGDIAVLLAEALVLFIGVWVAFDSEAGAIYVMFLRCFSSDVVEVYWLRRNWDLGNNAKKQLANPFWVHI